ncbi:hypothetical protein B0H19DRAFT_1268447 [Mycena capillaripes]|nr:hypothetical protein B0H19DRAFT_1268447 [Mycena capillaripes]
MSIWTDLHRKNFSLIYSAVFEHKRGQAVGKTPHLGIFLRLVERGPNYDRRSFVIDKVALIPWAPREAWSNVETGFRLLPGGEISSYTGEPYYQHSYSGITLPPGFDLHRYITHINRGITHFHGSFWPLPRLLSDAVFKEAEPPKEWLRYMRLIPNGFHCITSITETFGVSKRDGKRVPLYRYDKDVCDVSFDSRLEALAKIDTTEFKKLLDDPSRKVYLIPRCQQL